MTLSPHLIKLPYLLAYLFSLLPPCSSHCAIENGWSIRILDSGDSGPALLIVAATSPAGNCGHEALRQLQHRSPDKGVLILAQKNDIFAQHSAPDTWQLMNLDELYKRFPSRHTLIFREDFDAWSYTTQTTGDTVSGQGPVAQACLAAIKSQPAPAERNWKIIQSSDASRTIVTTNAKLNLKGGLRPSLRQREFRFAAYGAAEALGMANDWAQSDRLFPVEPSGITRVAVYDDRGARSSTGHAPAWLREKLALHPELHVELVGAKEIKTGVLQQIDVLVIGGGSATPQASSLGKDGRKLISDFVKAGGGYFGICAGACTGAGNFIGPNPKSVYPSINLIPIRFKETRLHKNVPLNWNQSPVTISKKEDADISGGPWFIVPENDSSISVWSRFESDEDKYSLAGVPAVISSLHGKGRVVLTSTHCERQPTDPMFFAKAVRWCDNKSIPTEQNP